MLPCPRVACWWTQLHPHNPQATDQNNTTSTGSQFGGRVRACTRTVRAPTHPPARPAAADTGPVCKLKRSMRKDGVPPLPPTRPAAADTGHASESGRRRFGIKSLRPFIKDSFFSKNVYLHVTNCRSLRSAYGTYNGSCILNFHAPYSNLGHHDPIFSAESFFFIINLCS